MIYQCLLVVVTHKKLGQTDQFLTRLDLLTNTQLRIEIYHRPSDWRVDSHID